MGGHISPARKTLIPKKGAVRLSGPFGKLFGSQAHLRFPWFAKKRLGGSRGCWRAPSPVGPTQNDKPHDERDPAVDRPLDLSGHETSRQHIDALQKPDTSEKHEYHAYQIFHDSHLSPWDNTLATVSAERTLFRGYGQPGPHTAWYDEKPRFLCGKGGT